MKLLVFAVRDRATDQFGNPFVLQSKGHAVRYFTDVVNSNDSDNQISRHPEDFDLFSLGEYETDTGLFNSHSPSQLAIGKDLKVTQAGRPELAK